MVNFSIQECNKIIDMSANYTFRHVSDIATFDNLNYSFLSLERDENTQWIFDRFSQFLKNRFPENKLDEMPLVNLHKYTKGCRFIKHSDLKRNSSHIYVVGSVISNNFTGGDFILYTPEEKLTREPGHIYGFDTTREHEVTEVTSGVRWALVMFLTKEDLNIKPSLF